MRNYVKIGISIFSFIVISCSIRNSNTSPTGDYVIRYVNLNSVYEYVYNNSNEAQDIKRKIDSLNKKIDELENSETDPTKKELFYYRGEILKVKEQEKKLKSELYSRIKTAVNNIAVKHNTDFILNSGDGVIYSREVYDLTYEVIKELKSINNRTAPINK